MSDVAAIIGRTPTALAGWRSRQRAGRCDTRIPDTEFDVDERHTLLWRASTVLAFLRDRGFYDGPVPDPMPLPDYVSVAYVMERCGVKRRTVQSWVADVVMPAPEAHCSGVPLWSRGVIDQWADAREKVPA